MIEGLEFASRWGIKLLDVARWGVWGLIDGALFWKMHGISTEWQRVLLGYSLALLFALLEFAFLQMLLDRSRLRNEIEKRFEGAFFHKKPTEPSDASGEQPKLQFEDLAFGYRESRRDGNLRLGALGIVMALALLIFYVPLPSRSALARPRSSTTIQFSPALNEDLGKILNRMCPPCPGALVCPQSSACPQPSSGAGASKIEGASGSSIPAWAIVLGIAALVAAAVVIFRRPETAPIFGVAELAREAVKNAEHLARLPWWLFLLIVILFLVIAGFFLLAGYRAIVLGRNSGRNPNQEDTRKQSAIKHFLAGLMGKDDKSSTGNLFLTVGFSVLVLTWIIVLLSYQSGPPSNSPTPPIISLANQRLPRPTFAPGHSDNPQKLSHLQMALNDQAKQGDLLLLLGSTDCTPRKKGNEGLALDRANTVEDRLKLEMSRKQVRIAVGNLPHQTACKESPESRAVIPFLVRLGDRGGTR